MNSKHQKRNERLRSNMREFGHERISSPHKVTVDVLGLDRLERMEGLFLRGFFFSWWCL
jgi:hypothetical protein